jgi:hypothetical protein
MKLRRCMVVAVSLAIWCPPAMAAASRGWFAAERGNVRVITNDSAATADAVLADAERFAAAMQLAAGARADRPLRIFALDGADALSEVAPWSLRRSDLHTFGFSQSGPHTGFVALRADRPRAAMIATLHHELVHALMASHAAEIPAWLDEGVADFWGALAIDGDRIIVGRPVDAHVRQLQRGKWLPLDKMTALPRGSLPSRGDVAQFYAQSWAMVHFLLLGQTNGNLTGWLPASNTTSPQFGANVRRYIAEAKWPTASLASPPAADHSALAEPLSESRALAERAAFLVFGQRPQAALTMARRALVIANDPLALETIGTYYFLNNEPERAREWLTRSLAAGPPSYTAAIYLSVLSASAADRARYLTEAVRIRPDSALAWEGLGRILRSDRRFAAIRRWCHAPPVVPLLHWLSLPDCGT